MESFLVNIKDVHLLFLLLTVINLSKGRVKNLVTLKDFDKVIKNQGQLVTVAFTAPWCTPCTEIKPKYELLAEKDSFKNVVFCNCDIEVNEKAFVNTRVDAMPSFLFYKKGLRIDSLEAPDIDSLEKKIQEHMT